MKKFKSYNKKRFQAMYVVWNTTHKTINIMKLFKKIHLRSVVKPFYPKNTYDNYETG